MGETAGIRRCGSAALDLAWVASGRFDGFWEHGLSPWDIAAGIVLVREAGGFVTDARRRQGSILRLGRLGPRRQRSDPRRAASRCSPPPTPAG